MKNKMKNKKGFTLMEMLIVVAIMVVLVAVAVPTFTSQVNRSNRAADLANERAAKAVAATEYLANELAAGAYPFDAATGTLGAKDGTLATGYGKSTPVKDAYVIVDIDGNGKVTTRWSNGKSVPAS